MSKAGKSDAETTLQELKDLVRKFETERGWQKHHTPKNVAISLCVEAAELLEHFTWDEYRQDDRKAIADELADIMLNCFNFANNMDIDITTAFMDKFERVQKKYPTDKFSPGNDNSDEYFRIRKEYRRKGQK